MAKEQIEMVPSESVPTQAAVIQFGEVIERIATNPDADVEKIERMLAMQERMLDRQAAMDFSAAMQSVQAASPKIVNDAYNGQTKSKYAKLVAIDKAIRPVYTAAGLSLSFGTEDSPLAEHVRIVCHIAHVSGHTEKRHLDLPLDVSGIKGNVNKTKTHAAGSTMTYGQRYLTRLIFNIVTSDDADDDGNAAGRECISDSQAEEIAQKVNDLFGKKPERFMKYLKETFGAGTIGEIPADGFDHVMQTLASRGENAK